MRPIQLFVATRDGQSRRIAEHICHRLSDEGRQVGLQVLPVQGPIDPPAAVALVVVVAAVRYGRHLPEAEAFLSLVSAGPSPPPLALVSVNLTARKAGRQSVGENQYLRKAIARHRLAPVLAVAVAGRLDYPRYRWWDRQMIRLIMAMTGGPADGTSTVEYTNWTQVDEIARDIARLAGVASA